MFVYVKLSELHEGDILIADGGFTCIDKGARLVVQKDERDEFFVLCHEGKHFLEGQYSDHDDPQIIGFVKA